MRRRGKSRVHGSSESCRTVRDSDRRFVYWPLSSSAEPDEVGADGVPRYHREAVHGNIDCAKRLIFQQEEWYRGNHILGI